MWIIISLTFLAASLTANLLEFLAFVIIRPFSVSFFRRVNAYLCYLHWSIIPWTLNNWCNLELRIFGVAEDIENIRQANTFTVINHRGDLDWMVGYCVCDRIKTLQAVKSVMKSFVKYLPTLGWSFWFSDYVFLKRSFAQDKHCLQAATKQWVSYDFPWMVILFAEGTRFTEEKHQKSLEYASKMGLPKLKYHLMPRTKGFNLIMKEIKNHVTAVCDATVTYPRGVPSISNFIRGEKVYADVNMRMIPISEVPVESEEELSSWLINLYKEKDDLVDYHHNHGRFPASIVDFPPRFMSTVVMTVWIVLLVVPFAFYVYTVVIAGAYWTLAILAIIILAAQLGMRLLMTVSEVPRVAEVRKKGQ
ncbi:1-acyl-sn-glycerol-3-phosphate acyltransferase delta-like [Corticium candelabrum]|uniref:1-acyl-sn-glycerol-3-phosphate acyltransferase delta-like n=1 Tax=Corticium candelabrum TaxID=121492 RepID=UPI002E261145|nr:1-acyl-sn-glycerol-3-phosphate acyltransferase delta-like [Corticium candelabrum]XP_062505494.1 1-acyl-sn-glycerol-3-phosphate acyltransferase delta-like [Corticium candelabrum]XP_062505495.1 1-acyl-sn-glycerol-3-phosphate acyltransferase delta-like [Corticium candelabrum]